MEVRPRQRLRPGVVLERGRVALRLVGLAELEADLDGVRVEVGRVVAHAAGLDERLPLGQEGTTLRPVLHGERQGAQRARTLERNPRPPADLDRLAQQLDRLAAPAVAKREPAEMAQAARLEAPGAEPADEGLALFRLLPA